ncbi:hypothetical protein ACWCXH_35305 [Kitasatospora sp. NPDC001660]
MSRDDDKAPNSPQDWRDLLRSDYRYPAELDTLSRRQRRRAKKAWRHQDRTDRLQWLREQREAEPATAGRTIVLVVALVAVVFGSALFFRHGHTPVTLSSSGGGAVTATATAPAVAPVSTTPAASPSTAPPVLTDPAVVAEGFTRVYLTRNPMTDHNHAASVHRAAKWMAPPLVDNLTTYPDPAFDALVSRAGVATVTAVKVESAGNDLPGDSPLRVWRKVTATIAVAGQGGHDSYTDTRVLTEEMTTSGDGQWRVSRILGV